MLRLFIVLFSCYMVLCRRIGGFDFNTDSDVGLKCKSDEELQWIQACPGETTCGDRYDQRLCLAVVQPSYPACVCKGGLRRSENGSCFTDEQCDKEKCPGDHEHYECDTECDNVCATLDRQNKTNCPIRRFVNFNICSPKCYCDDGYARDDQGNCILIENCGPLSSAD